MADCASGARSGSAPSAGRRARARVLEVKRTLQRGRPGGATRTGRARQGRPPRRRRRAAAAQSTSEPDLLPPTTTTRARFATRCETAASSSCDEWSSTPENRLDSGSAVHDGKCGFAASEAYTTMAKGSTKGPCCASLPPAPRTVSVAVLRCEDDGRTACSRLRAFRRRTSSKAAAWDGGGQPAAAANLLI
eukprot:7378667-Prymnesium_polylepis.1